MSLPSNYKQIAVGVPSGPATPASGGGSSGGGRSRSSGAGGSERNKDATPIFTHSNYGNPAFTPQKAGKSSSSKNQSESRAPKPPKAPEKPALPYMRYSKRVWDSVKAQHPELKLWELSKKIGAIWKQLPDIEKQEYIDEYEADKLEYEKALKAYHNSPPYLAYMAAKSKVKTDADVHETPSRASGKSQQERRIDIQPAEDEDDQDEGYSFKHVAYARYLRNHRLINEIFSDAVVPDVRSVVTTQRMQVLKRQVSSLTMHQTKLEAELQQMEEKFETKKQRMMQSSEAFQEELKRHCKPAVDEDTFQKMVQRMYEEMKRDRQRTDDPKDPNMLAANVAITNRAEDKSQSAPTAPVAVTGSATSIAIDKTDSTQSSLPKPTQEPNSKTDTEVMDTEMSSKPAGSVLCKSGEPRPTESPKPQKPAIETLRDACKTMNPTSGKPSQPGPTPTPPPPTPPPVTTANTTNNPPINNPSAGPYHPPGSYYPASGAPHYPVQPMPAPTGPTRSPYYQAQYGPHPSQPYGQYTPYSHYQQPYGPPPGPHYMNSRPPPQHNGSPVHYTEHYPPQPHDVYGQPQHNSVPPQQQPLPAAAPQPTSAAPAPPTSDPPKPEPEKKED